MSGIQGFLDQSHERLPTKNVARFSEQSLRMSMLKLKTYSEALKNGLTNSGLRVNDKLVVLLPHNGEHATLQVACALAQVEMITFTETPTTESIKKVLIDTNARGIFFDPRFCKVDTQTMVEDIVVIDDYEMVVTPDVPELKFVYTTGFDFHTCYQRFKDMLLFHYMGVTRDLRGNVMGAEKDYKWITTVDGKGNVTGTHKQPDIVARAQKLVTELNLNADSSFCLSSAGLAPDSLAVGVMASVISSAQLIAPDKYPKGKVSQEILDNEKCVGSFGNAPVEGLKHAAL